jgi:AcrR family transcriptional regulator
MMRTPVVAASLSEHKKRAVQQQVSAVALELFTEQGFDHTTVDEIARAAGMSRTSFFRYFATKEDVVLFGNEQTGRLVLAHLIERPLDEPVWTSLRLALAQASIRVDMPRGGLEFVQMILAAPSLRSRHLEKQRSWRVLLAPEVSRRLQPFAGTGQDIRADALINAGFACLETAAEAWAASDGVLELPLLLEQAMATISN